GYAAGTMMSAATDNSAFAFDIFSVLKQKGGNLFFSPYSISSALAMTYGGARGDTALQMQEAMRFNRGQEGTHKAFAELGSLLGNIQSKGAVELAVANSIWPQTGYGFLPEYTALLKKFYGVEITPVDYANAPEPSRKRINKWVEVKTREKIKDLIPEGSIDPLTRLVLVNAIYFKGDWAEQFDPADTVKAPFFVTPEKSIEASLMTRTGEYRYSDMGDLQILELPYAGRDLSMVVILPGPGRSISDLEKKFTIENFFLWQKSMSEKEVEVFLPRFRITWGSFSLVEALKSLGMVDAFSDTKADLSGMDGSPDLYITDVLHKAFIDVNEEGTEAAAATAVIVGLKSIPAPPEVFRADRPFIFIIQENSTGSILFMGRVSDPSKGE
ncbi:MAG: serpin family protein, partial [Thermovirgaceae bacterium]|nr:serpin family protein [Thermovirgaceae bacterium]